jgi:hypothetical protein
MTNRNFTFGKYKNQPIKKIILTHIGYILWCFDNLQWFSLTEDEQELYDMITWAIQDSDCDTVYPKEDLKKHVKGAQMVSPFMISSNGEVYVREGSENDPIVASVLQYRETPVRLPSMTAIRGAGSLSGLAHSASKFFNDDFDDDDDRFLGADPYIPLY